MDLLYFGYDFYADCLCALLKDGSIRVHHVYTFPCDGIFESHQRLDAIAQRHGVAVSEVPPSSEELSDFFRTHAEGLVVCAGYPWRIPAEQVEGFRGINLHPSILPEGRGPWPFPYVILQGCTQSGITIHKLAAGFDRGEILAQTIFPVASDETLITLSEKSQAAAPQLLENCLQNFSRLWENAIPQREGSYWPDHSDEDRVILSSMTAEEADRRLRAFAGYGVLIRFTGGEIQATDGRVRPDIIGSPGTLQKRSDGGWAVAIKESSIWFSH